MKTGFRWAAGAALAAGLGFGFWFEFAGAGRPALAQGASAEAPGPKLPIKKVVLFSSGVGYFQREGHIDGDASLDLTFPASDVNDLLKSMTLQDLGNGKVRAVSYDSHDPVERTLKSFAIDLSGNPGQGQILAQARGEKVEVSLAAGTPIVGTIVGIEYIQQVVKDATTQQVAMLNLMTGEGLRSFKLAEVVRVKFLNPTLEAELRKALETLTLSRDTNKKAVSLRFTGNGKRPVRVSYVVENPIWKTTYRMVLDKEGKPFLQGWAVVENPTDDDWTDVRMALVSGRPISFRMDLYSPIYVPRPVVEPELFASLRPPTYEGAMTKRGESSNQAGGVFGGVGAAMPAPAAPLAEKARVMVDRDQAGAKPSGNPVASYAFRGRDAAEKMDDKKLDLSQGVSAAAVGAQLGDFFQYTLEETVTIPRQKSAMLPIVNKEVEGTRVSIYNAQTHPKYPLLGLKFKNTSGLNLMQGPVTLFEGTTYAGDARLPDLQPGSDRLLSYAIDLGSEVETHYKAEPAVYTTIKIDKGVLYATRKIKEERVYKAVNRSETDRTLLIEHPVRHEYTLVGVKPAEQSRDQYRFELKLPANGKAEIGVPEERSIQQAVGIINTDMQQILFYMRLPSISPKVKAALEQAVKLKSEHASAQRELANVTRQLGDIVKEQERLRANIKELPPTAAAYKRILEKFDQQETQIEKLQADQKRLQEMEQLARAKVDQYLSGLTVE